MAQDVERALPDAARERIREVVAETETRTSAEVVVYVVGRSASYPAAPWRAAVGSGLLGTVLWSIWRTLELGADPSKFEIVSLGALLPGVLAGALGATLATRLDPIARWLTSAAERERAVLERAERAFLAEEVFATRGRTGVLLFVSLFERLVRVVPDRGVEGVIEEGEWTEITEHVATAIRSGDLGPALEQGVVESGELMASRGLKTERDDRDELDNRVRIDSE